MLVSDPKAPVPKLADIEAETFAPTLLEEKKIKYLILITEVFKLRVCCPYSKSLTHELLVLNL